MGDFILRIWLRGMMMQDRDNWQLYWYAVVDPDIVSAATAYMFQLAQEQGIPESRLPFVNWFKFLAENKDAMITYLQSIVIIP